MIGKEVIAGAMVGRKMVTIGLHPDVARLKNLGFSRRISNVIERYPNPNGDNRCLQMLQNNNCERQTRQVEHDEYVRNRKERLKENPHLGI